MGKRFTETGKWADKWFRTLSPMLKIGWLYLCDNCDAAGVIELDDELANFKVGMEVDWKELVNAADGRIEALGDGVYWIVGFVEFQYVSLSRSSKPHISVIRQLERYGLQDHPSVIVVDESDRAGAVRKRITRKYRESIYTRDEFRCQSCGHQFPKHELTLDHLVGIHAGGRNSEENLYTFCQPCNSRKGQFSLAEFLSRNEITLPDNRLSRFIQSLPNGLQSLLGFPETLKDKEQEQDKEKDKGGAGGKAKRAKFAPPTVEEAQAYCDERKNGIVGQKFVDHYQARGWKVKGGGLMTDWKAAVRTWEGNEFNRGSPEVTRDAEYRRVSLVVFNAHAKNGDFLVGPHKDPGEGFQRVFGQLKSKRKIESHTDPDWTP